MTSPAEQNPHWPALRDLIADTLGLPTDFVRPDSVLEELGADTWDRCSISIEIEETWLIITDDDAVTRAETAEDFLALIPLSAKVPQPKTEDR